MTDNVDLESAVLMRAVILVFHSVLLLAVPILLIAGSARVVMLRQFLEFEYSRAGFPEDTYGFTTQDRLNFGPLGIAYLLNNREIDFLGDLTLPADLCFPRAVTRCAMFNQSELDHMEDVKTVTQGVFWFAMVWALAAAISAFWLWNKVGSQFVVHAVTQGSVLTLGIVVCVIVLAVFSWDVFFSSFHSIFFEDGTWQFFFSDTLIRLYPQQFWFDAALFTGTLITAGALIMLVSLRQLSPGTQKQ